jgi:hypothetical protein
MPKSISFGLWILVGSMGLPQTGRGSPSPKTIDPFLIFRYLPLTYFDFWGSVGFNFDELPEFR